ncbi:MAG: hypothetical protein VKK07_00120 [Merismopediaceae bacterium]|nr:hypothetical protein [Merismopediaceae bacterium]
MSSRDSPPPSGSSRAIAKPFIHQGFTAMSPVRKNEKRDRRF